MRALDFQRAYFQAYISNIQHTREGQREHSIERLDVMLDEMVLLSHV